jgi:hypothetical protein
MAEKRVSVRLSAVGGKQVRAELEGVGEAGSKGFGRLSREMEAANARLAGFARKAGIAMAAAASRSAGPRWCWPHGSRAQACSSPGRG